MTVVLCALAYPTAATETTYRHFKIQVLDSRTGRGVPLVQLRTTNHIRLYTDSNGIIAFDEPGLMDRQVFFFVESHGYEFPKDGFGFRGVRLKTTRGSSATVKIDRINVAQRLYRVTGQGIYRDSILTGDAAPTKQPVLNGQVTGQDSVYTCIHRGRLFWLWGDTNRPSYPLGHFMTSGAFSNLPGSGGLDPSVGVNLEYMVDENGFSRPVCPLPERGLVWLDGLFSAQDDQGRTRMVAMYARMKDLGHAYDRGLVVFNDDTHTFEPAIRTGPDFLPYHNAGHAIPIAVDGTPYAYFGTQFPLTARLRVRRQWDHILDPNRYEVLTQIEPTARPADHGARLDVGGLGAPYRWLPFGRLLDNDASAKSAVIKTLRSEKEPSHLYDIESGKKVKPHGGTVYFNRYRGRWVSIFVQSGGDNSYLGEVWYAEADSPVGPFGYARKIATHNKYSFYNPMHHPYFDQDDGRTIFFEGTYTHTFSGSTETATPRYDYNQIMYRLDLADARLALPAPVYTVQTPDGSRSYQLGSQIEQAGAWELVNSVAFFAFEPNRATDDMIGVFAALAGAQSNRTVALTTKRPDDSASVLFLALPPADPPKENPCITGLYEFRQTGTDRRFYTTNPQWNKKDWTRTKEPICHVWKKPSQPMLLDYKAKPLNTY